MCNQIIGSGLFVNKLETLLYLKDRLTLSSVLDILFFSVDEYITSPETICTEIANTFDDEVIIRSSASTEDQKLSTNAGHFVSVQSVPSGDKKAIQEAVDRVIKSYRRDNLPVSEKIFVQKQMQSVKMAGVALSFEVEKSRPYFLINYDLSGSTNSVTGGKSSSYMFIARDSVGSCCLESRLCKAFLEIETVCESDLINIEFAIDEKEQIIIFQVRKLLFVEESGNALQVIERKNKLKMAYASRKDKKLLSDMAFWNPSEIIGDAPHPLDYSLYDYLVTQKAWNVGIADIGYYKTKENLMTQIGNKPYIDMNLAFLALTPVDLNDKIRNKLVEYYTNQIISNKALHDKIEFEVCFACYDYCCEERIRKALDKWLSPEEINELIKCLYDHTYTIIRNYDAIVSNDITALEKLESKLLETKGYVFADYTEKIKALKTMLDCICIYGIVPFARQARCAFIARAICISAAQCDIVSRETIDRYMRSLYTVTQEMRMDLMNSQKGKVTKEEIMLKYGHLRASSYNILSETYKQLGYDKIFGTMLNTRETNLEEEPDISLVFPGTEYQISRFVKSAIRNREYFKFIFTKALSYSLDLIDEIGTDIGINRNEIAFLRIGDIFGMIDDSEAINNIRSKISKNRSMYDLDSQLILPSVLSEEKDFDIIHILRSIPNFITDMAVTGDVLVLDNSGNDVETDGKIIVLQNADPGYDWLFIKGRIAGLITKYGGVASHMAIRCLEFGIPAAIGCGEIIYNTVKNSKCVKLDCLNKEVLSI